MCALPLPIQVPGSRGLERRIDAHVAHVAELWFGSPARLERPERLSGRLERYANARRTARFVDELAIRLEACPRHPDSRRLWRRRLRERIRAFGTRRLAWPNGYGRLVVGDDFRRSTATFVRRARSFAPSISPEDLFQALRNVWIVNSIQLLLGLPVECTRPAFAYSMLYPWTDNLLDAPSVDRRVKLDLDRRLGRRLAGLSVTPVGDHQREVFELVAMIETALPRHHHPTAWASLLAIHQAQRASLEPQRRQLPGTGILELSLRKGGSSVLPDGYLLVPRLTPERERFLFGYGAFLQLLDDLQDVDADRAAGHQTLFTLAQERGPLDAPTAMLWNFIDSCLSGGSGVFTGGPSADAIDLIRRNCRSLLVAAVAERPACFSAAFKRRLTGVWPLSLGAMRRLRRRSRRRLGRAVEALRAQLGDEALSELLVEEADARVASPSIRRS